MTLRTLPSTNPTAKPSSQRIPEMISRRGRSTHPRVFIDVCRLARGTWTMTTADSTDFVPSLWLQALVRRSLGRAPWSLGRTEKPQGHVQVRGETGIRESYC